MAKYTSPHGNTTGYYCGVYYSRVFQIVSANPSVSYNINKIGCDKKKF